uniref:(northern house mosquito) hypothetical protein n=1 Tax=Culex pipiens TaxID=7175 RepID=A0A8D8HE62_CULPI
MFLVFLSRIRNNIESFVMADVRAFSELCNPRSSIRRDFTYRTIPPRQASFLRSTAANALLGHGGFGSPAQVAPKWAAGPKVYQRLPAGQRYRNPVHHGQGKLRFDPCVCDTS